LDFQQFLYWMWAAWLFTVLDRWLPPAPGVAASTAIFIIGFEMSDPNNFAANDNVAMSADGSYSINGRPIDRNTPLRLKVAASLLFPDGSMTVAGLRAEAQRGRLVIYRLANKDYTTIGNVQGMLEKCRVSNDNHDYGSDQGARGPAARRSPQRGSSSTTASKLAQDALSAKLQKHKAPSIGI
jgi:hypothetical protein